MLTVRLESSQAPIAAVVAATCLHAPAHDIPDRVSHNALRRLEPTWKRPRTNARANRQGNRGPPSTQKPNPSSNSISSSTQRASVATRIDRVTIHRLLLIERRHVAGNKQPITFKGTRVQTTPNTSSTEPVLHWVSPLRSMSTSQKDHKEDAYEFRRCQKPPVSAGFKDSSSNRPIRRDAHQICASAKSLGLIIRTNLAGNFLS